METMSGCHGMARRAELVRTRSEEVQRARGLVETHLIRSVVNELLRLAATGAQEWICECGHAGCECRIVLPVDEYEELRARPHRFVVAPSPRHVLPEVDEIVQRTASYWIVELTSKAQTMAQSFRSRTRAYSDSSGYTGSPPTLA